MYCALKNSPAEGLNLLFNRAQHATWVCFVTVKTCQKVVTALSHDESSPSPPPIPL